MDVSSVVKAYLRRPVFVAAVVVAALAGALFGWMGSKVTYTSVAMSVVAPPRADAQGNTQNPLAGISSNSSQLALVVAALAGASDVAAAAAGQGGTVDLVDTTVGGDSAAPVLTPQINITVKADTEVGAERAAQAALDRTRQKLTDLQERSGVRQAAQQVQLLQVSDPQAQPSAGTSRLRAAIGYGLGATLLALALTVFLSSRDAGRRADDADEWLGSLGDKR